MSIKSQKNDDSTGNTSADQDIDLEVKKVSKKSGKSKQKQKVLVLHLKQNGARPLLVH
jgi:hypothetical protein